MSHIVLYISFALCAVLLNLGVQRFVIEWFPSLSIWYAILAGTVAGLLLKYWLDRRWIFAGFASASPNHREFLSYSATGMLTTIIFWGSEWIAWAMTQEHYLRELGAVIGLSIGYYLKFRLDRRFVFIKGATT